MSGAYRPLGYLRLHQKGGAYRPLGYLRPQVGEGEAA